MLEGANGLEFQGLFTRDLGVQLHGEMFRFKKGQRIPVILVDVSPVINKGPLNYVTVVTFLADLNNTGEYVMFSMRLNYDIMLSVNPDEETVYDNKLTGKKNIGFSVTRDFGATTSVSKIKNKRIKDSDFASSEFDG